MDRIAIFAAGAFTPTGDMRAVGACLCVAAIMRLTRRANYRPSYRR